MPIIRTRSANTNLILWIVAAIVCLEMTPATAQIQGMTATVARSAPGAMLHSGGAWSALRQGATLRPGDMIDTGSNGRVVIDLGDGSQVIIFPRSSVQLKDFQSAGSWRDLLKVTVGRVRATINHGKRPNPYRVYSPIASIAVRGTDFSVTVEPSGETRVLVYEGLVEVGSLVNPQKTVLVRPGRNIIVRPDGDISMVTAAPRGELNEIRSLQTGLGDQATRLRDAFNSHGNSYTGLQPSRFTAFNDLFLDGLRNPAYATEFRQPGARFYLTPSYGPKHGAVPSNYTVSPQASYFMPLGSRIVVGAGASVTKTDIGGAEAKAQFNILNKSGMYRFEGDVKFTTANLSLIAARQFGRDGRTSFGVKVDYLIDRSRYSFNRDTTDPMYPEPAWEEGKERGRRAGLSVGLTRDVGDDKKLGVYYRYGMSSFKNDYRNSGSWGFINDEPHFFPGGSRSRARPGHSSEAGVLFRGSVTRRLFYGVESSMLFERDQEESPISFPITIGDTIYISTETYLDKRRIRQGMIGAGIGYALRQRTVLSLDLSVGRAREDSLGQTHFSDLPTGIHIGADDDYAHERSSFRALHIGGQTDIWRSLFAGGSLLYNSGRKRSVSGLDVPEEDRRPQTIYSSEYSSYEKYKLMSVSFGWRLAPSWIVQYVYSTIRRYDEVGGPSNHTLMFRYELGRREEK